MAKGMRWLGLALAAVVASGTVAAAGTTYSTSVSGIVKDSTVSVQGETQCPQRGCNPQIAGKITVTWDGGKFEQSGSATVEKADATGDVYKWHEEFVIKGNNVPAGKTLSGNVVMTADREVTFKSVKSSVSK